MVSIEAGFGFVIVDSDGGRLGLGVMGVVRVEWDLDVGRLYWLV